MKPAVSLSVSRFEGDSVVLLWDDDAIGFTYVTLPRAWVPADAREDDVLSLVIEHAPGRDPGGEP